jgi:Notch-like protein
VQIVVDFDDCVNSTCNNGTCVNGVDEYTCDCDAGYTGEFCEENVDDCVGVVCLNGASCEVSIGSYYTLLTHL